MLQSNATAIFDVFATSWGMAAGLAGALLGLTLLAARLLNPDRKDEIALWLMGAQSEESWAKSFCSLFDAVFGARHLSWRCIWRSALASVLAVVLIWLLMGNSDALGLRLQADLSLGSILIYAIAINVVADYISLLETRWLLGQLHRVRSWVGHVLVLLADLVITAAIIWVAIRAFIASPLYAGEAESFAEVLGVFSVFSVLFYSTFLTSAWSWAYIATTWILRLFTGLNLAHWLNVERKPLTVLGYVLAAVVFVATLAISTPLARDADGLSLVDRGLCTVFKGEVCLDVAGLSQSEQAQLEMILLACEGGLTEECYTRSFVLRDVDRSQEARLLEVACAGNSARACTDLGVLHGSGLGMAVNYAEAARLYALGCDGGNALGCTNLGLLHEIGREMVVDYAEAARFYTLGCDGGDAVGCTNLGVLHHKGLGRNVDYAEAARLYTLGCDGGDARACTNLGVLHERGLGKDVDYAEATRLYTLSCDEGYPLGCVNLGLMFENGIGRAQDLREALRLYGQACDLRSELGCGYRHRLAAETQ